MKDLICAHLPPAHPWKDKLHCFDCVDSTNDRAKAMAAGGAPHGTVLIADRQTSGRGRMGRTFHSPSGAGIYLSVILRPDCPPQQLMHLTCAVAVAMCGAVEKASGFCPNIKWPNDLVSRGKKLAGILTELSIDPCTQRVDYAVIGIGINCCQHSFPAELQDTAVSLSMLTGENICRAALAAAMIMSLFEMDQTLFTEKERIMARYRALCVTIGAQIVLRGAEGERFAKALDVDNNGALIAQTSDGNRLTVTSGEVSIRKIGGYA